MSARATAIDGAMALGRSTMTRRQAMFHAAGVGLAGTSLAACSSTDSEQDMAQALRRASTEPIADRQGLMRELVRHATLAPSSHNTQCWRFRLQDRSVTIEPDLTRRCDPAHWVEAGRCYERFALQATALDVRNAMLNQPVEVAAIRPRFASAIGVGGARVDLVVRFGRGPAMPLSMRRPVDAVIV